MREVIACPDCARDSSETVVKAKESPRQIRPTQSEMIEAYLNHVLTGSPEYEWAVSPMVMMTFSAPPEQQWEIILELIEKAPDNDHVLGDIAAGPLEGLLGRHGEKVISWIERQVKDDPKFARTLTGVWQYMMSDEVWGRVQELQAAIPNPLYSKGKAEVST